LNKSDLAHIQSFFISGVRDSYQWARLVHHRRRIRDGYKNEASILDWKKQKGCGRHIIL